MPERLRKAFRRHGVAGLIKLIPRNAWYALSYFAPRRRRLRRSMFEFDRRFGVDTAGFNWISKFELDPDVAVHANSYGPIHNIEPYLRPLDIAFEKYTFVDYGCGKGRALLMASDFPFKEIIGVEFVPALLTMARRNVQLYRNSEQKCHAIRIVESDAAVFEPPSTPTVFFLYNPFDAVVLTKVLSRIRKVHAGKKSTNYLIYCDPAHRGCIEAEPGWETVGDYGSWVLYRSSFESEAGQQAGR
jgi:SAM-dependent methyltransferase